MHVAIVMSGNGRWAARRGLAPTAGCFDGAVALRATVAAAMQAGVKTLALYAARAADPLRPAAEADADRSVICRYLRAEHENCARRKIEISLIGRCAELAAQIPLGTRQSRCEAVQMRLRLVVDPEIDGAALAAGPADVLIRTGGAKSRGDFIPWELADARLYSSDCLWPDFTARELQRALAGLERLPQRQPFVKLSHAAASGIVK